MDEIISGILLFILGGGNKLYARGHQHFKYESDNMYYTQWLKWGDGGGRSPPSYLR
jgi:hypothetical protein